MQGKQPTRTVTRGVLWITLGLLFGGCGPKEKVIAISLPPQPNQHAQYVCQAQPGPTEELKLDCKSGVQEYTAQQIVNLKTQVEGCASGAAKIWIVLSSQGDVTRVQYQCGAQESGDVPTE